MPVNAGLVMVKRSQTTPAKGLEARWEGARNAGYSRSSFQPEYSGADCAGERGPCEIATSH